MKQRFTFPIQVFILVKKFLFVPKHLDGNFQPESLIFPCSAAGFAFLLLIIWIYLIPGGKVGSAAPSNFHQKYYFK